MFEVLVTRIPLPTAYSIMSNSRGCIIGSPSPCKCSSVVPMKLIDQPREHCKVHERRTTCRAIVAKLNRAHLAAQVALSDRLDLDEMGELHAIALSPGEGRFRGRIATTGIHRCRAAYFRAGRPCNSHSGESCPWLLDADLGRKRASENTRRIDLTSRLRQNAVDRLANNQRIAAADAVHNESSPDRRPTDDKRSPPCLCGSCGRSVG